MKKQLKSKMGLLSASLVMLLFAVSVNAQRPGRQGPPRDFQVSNRPDSALVNRMVGRMAEDLALTDSQKEKIKELHYAHMAEAKKQREKNREEAEKHRTEMDKAREEMDKSIMNVLNDDQQEKFETYHSGRGPGRMGPDCPYRDAPRGKGPGKRGYYCPNR